MNRQAPANPLSVFVKLLGIVFIAEAAVMLLLPRLFPAGGDQRLVAILDSCLLTAICAPLIWWVIIGPLRTSAAAEKMMAVGRMATGVAHELRNPLTSVKMLVQSHRETLQTNGRLAEDLQIIEDEIRRMEGSIQLFLDFARPRRAEIHPVDMREIAQRLLSLLEPRADKQQVQLQLLAPDGPVIAAADRQQMQQLLLNLTINALDAMPRGGRLTIEVAENGDGQVRVRVEDTGTGMAADVLRELFQPFVTSKETGIGLGLFLSKRIADDHGALLRGENRLDGGARFELILPAARQPAAPSPGGDVPAGT